eukprot:1153032-Pelagomonas_calceolata.AAC.2
MGSVSNEPAQTLPPLTAYADTEHGCRAALAPFYDPSAEEGVRGPADESAGAEQGRGALRGREAHGYLSQRSDGVTPKPSAELLLMLLCLDQG